SRGWFGVPLPITFPSADKDFRLRPTPVRERLSFVCSRIKFVRGFGVGWRGGRGGRSRGSFVGFNGSWGIFSEVGSSALLPLRQRSFRRGPGGMLCKRSVLR